FLVAGIVHLLVRKKKRYNYTELVCICLYLFGVWTAAGELLEGLAGLHKHGRLAFLLPAVFVFRKPLLRKLTRWRREKRLRPFVLLFLLLSAFLSISSPSLAPFVSLLFWAYYMKKLYSLSNLKSALYVLVFHALYLALLLSAGTAVLFLIVKFNT
ncbi:MAG: hypothetical protein MI784_11945, partial [Cytophagales bacterium]|nr:hypothetical protein [Cytophagales bacterium]